MAERKKFQGNENSGRKPYQSMKPYLVYQYLLKESDEENIKKATDIADQLENEYGISTKARSIFKDVETMNQAILIANENARDIEEAIEMCENTKNHTIVYDSNYRGFYIPKRREKINDLYTILDCIYAAPFLDKDTALRLADMVCSEFVSNEEKDNMLESTYVPNKKVSDYTPLLKKLNTIRIALKKRVDGKAHIPEAIKFKYSEYQIEDVLTKAERTKTSSFDVEPYKIFICDGNYYLFGLDNGTNKRRTFEINRMEKIKLSPSERYVHLRAEEIRLWIDEYTKNHLGKFGYAKYKERVTLQFNESLLDTVVDKFGVLDAVYTKTDDKQYLVTVPVEISSQFFGWLCGIDGNIEILEPLEVKQNYLTHLRRKIRKNNFATKA